MRWEVKTLGELFEKGSSNLTLKAVQKKTGPYKVYGAKGHCGFSDSYDQEYSYFAVIKDGAGVGRISCHEPKTSVLATMQYLVPTEQENFRFLHYALLNLKLSAYSVGSTIPHIYFKDYKNSQIRVPRMEEQERIVEILDQAFEAIDKAKANIERNLANARELFQSRLNEIFSNPPADWEVKPLGSMTKTGAGGTPLKSNSAFYNPPEIPWLLSGEVGQREIQKVKNKISTLGLEKSSAKIFPTNSVLVAMYGATAGEVGVLKVDAATNQAVCAIYPCEKIGHDFLYYFLLFFKDALVAQAVGGAQPNVSQAKIKTILTPVPPPIEQDFIVNELNTLSNIRDRLITTYRFQLNNLEELRQSILEQAFEGKLTEPVTS